MTVGSFQDLSWRMDPSVSYSDWTLEITRTPSSSSHSNSGYGDDTAPPSAAATTSSSSSSTTTTTTSSIDRYHVHRNILAVGPRHGEYFAAQFQLETQETLNRTSRIELDHSSADAFPLLLDFLYNGGKIPDLTASNAACLYHLSEYFDMPELRSVVELYYRQNLTKSTLVEYICHAQEHHAQALVEIAIDKSVHFLLEIDRQTACELGPELLLEILKKNEHAGNRRYGFHTSNLVADCCCHHEQNLEESIFRQLTETQILPYMDAKAAIYLLSIDAKWVVQPSPTSASSESEALTPLQQRCTQSLTEKWKSIRAHLPNDAPLSKALSKVPPHILIDILIKATSDESLNASDYDLEEKEMPNEAPPRIYVQNAGIPEVNGVYSKDGLFQGVSMYTRPGNYKGENCLFSMFQCLVGSKTKRWFISTIPLNGRPGTTKDIDFFSALVTDECILIPPQRGWRKSSDGEEPPPTLLF